MRLAQSSLDAKSHESATLRLREAFDGVTKRRSGDGGDVTAQVCFEPARIHSPGFSQRPADGLLNEVLLIGMERACGIVSKIQCNTFSDWLYQVHDGCPS